MILIRLVSTARRVKYCKEMFLKAADNKHEEIHSDSKKRKLSTVATSIDVYHHLSLDFAKAAHDPFHHRT